MNARKGLFVVISITILLVLAASAVQPVNGAALQVGSPHTPWTVKYLETDTDVTQLSTAFGGSAQVPIISGYYEGMIRFIFKDPTGDGICGPNDEWECEWIMLGDQSLLDGSLSNVATHTYTQTFKVAWVFEAIDKKVYVYWREYIGATMQFVDDGLDQVYQLADDTSISGRPSLALDSGGNEHIALTIHDSDPVPTRTLKYIYYSNTTQTSCGFSSRYQCDTIDSSGTISAVGSYPQIALTSSGSPRILYYHGGDPASLIYARPTTNALYHPNCGPGDNTWRCVTLTNNVDGGSDFDLDIHADGSMPQMAWTSTDGLSQTWVNHARNVGHLEGNCGQDYYLISISPPATALGYLWDCTQTAEVGLNATVEYTSIAVDSSDNPVIALNVNNGDYFDLGVIYGQADGTYDYLRVDGGHGVTTGLDPALSLDRYGHGLVAFIEDTAEYEPSLKFAFQMSYNFLPAVVK